MKKAEPLLTPLGNITWYAISGLPSPLAAAFSVALELFEPREHVWAQALVPAELLAVEQEQASVPAAHWLAEEAQALVPAEPWADALGRMVVLPRVV
jgi:hypothetical protein